MIARDEWLSTIFGYPVHSVGPSASDVSVVEHARTQARALYFTRVDVAGVERVSELTSVGFSVIDTTLTFARPAAPPIEPEPGVIEVRAYDESDHDIVLDIAGRSFLYSRFHLDGRIPKDTADRIKREWIRSYTRGARGDRLWVATFGDSPIGFNAVMLSTDAGRKVGLVDLIAVAPEHQASGAGSGLLRHFFRTYSPRVEELHVGTQAANTRSVRLYERLGFRLYRASYVLHLHVVDGEVVR